MILRALVAATALLLGAAQACEVPVLNNARTLSDGKGFDLVFRFVPAPPKVGQFFAIEFGGCATIAITADTMRVDAIMPLHRHGMNFQPQIGQIGPGIYRAEGLMFHMPGTWQLIFEQRTPAGAVRLTTDIEIE